MKPPSPFDQASNAIPSWYLYMTQTANPFLLHSVLSSTQESLPWRVPDRARRHREQRQRLGGIRTFAPIGAHRTGVCRAVRPEALMNCYQQRMQR